MYYSYIICAFPRESQHLGHCVLYRLRSACAVCMGRLIPSQGDRGIEKGFRNRKSTGCEKCLLGLSCAVCLDWSGSILYAKSTLLAFSWNGSIIKSHVTINSNLPSLWRMDMTRNVPYTRHNLNVVFHWTVLILIPHQCAESGIGG